MRSLPSLIVSWSASSHSLDHAEFSGPQSCIIQSLYWNGSAGLRSLIVTSMPSMSPLRSCIASPAVRARSATAIDLAKSSSTVLASAVRPAALPWRHCWNPTTPSDAAPVIAEAAKAVTRVQVASVTVAKARGERLQPPTVTATRPASEAHRDAAVRDCRDGLS